MIYFDMYKYVYSESVFNTLSIETKHRQEKKFRDETKGTKKTHDSFPFNLRFFYELNHKVCISEFVCGIFHFRFRFVLIKDFCSTKCIGSLILKRHNSFQN